MVNAQEKLQERLKLFDDTIHFRKTSRTPTECNIWTWAIFDSDLNVTLEEAVSDWSIMEQVMRRLQERYDFDTYHMPGNRNNGQMTRALGFSSHHIIGDNINVVDDAKIDDLEAFTADPVMYTWTKVGPKYFSDLTLGRMKQALAAQKACNDYTARITDVFNNEYGTTLMSSCYALPPLETLLSYRGLKKFSLDLRRNAKFYRAFDESQEESMLAYVTACLDAGKGNCVADVLTCFMAHNVLNKKQFETLYWPTIKKVYDLCAERGAVIFNFWEADCIRFAEYFADYPKGFMIIHPEAEDVRDVRKAFPNACIQGGMPIELLSKGTPQQCVDYANRLVDDMGDGFIFSTTKMLSFKNDCTRENLTAVMDFVHNYRR